MSFRVSKLSLKRKEVITFYIFVSPVIVGLAVFVMGPIVVSLIMSFMRWTMMQPAQFVGIANYQRIFLKDPWIRDVLKATVLFATGAVPLRVAAALVVAMILNQKIRGLGVFRTIYYLPSMVIGAPTIILWALLFQKQGLVNGALALVGISGPDWLHSLTWALPVVISISLWSIGAPFLIFLAALQGVPNQLYEAARIDGASGNRMFFSITLPLLTPALLLNVIMAVIGSLREFIGPFIMTGGGPGRTTLFWVLYLYQNAFVRFRMGYACALAWLLFIMILAFTVILLRSSKRWIYYSV